MKQSESKRFFFEKKKQKTFAHCGLWQQRRHGPQQIRVFLLLFLQKKKFLLPTLAFKECARWTV
jgi:putative SOS response-associated peptidase YedK